MSTHRVLQAYGLGRSAMTRAEQMARAPPLNASITVLDTVKKEVQLEEEFLKALFEDRGYERPKNLRPNEEWFKKQGYEVFREMESTYRWQSSGGGGAITVPMVYLKKSVADI